MQTRSAPFTLPLLWIGLLLLTASAAAMPTGVQTWTEVPWTGQQNGTPQTAETTLSDPITFSLKGNEPRAIIIGEAQYNFSEGNFDSCIPACRNSSVQLWIQKGETWMRHDQMEAGDPVQLIAHAPLDGNVDLYLISYANRSILHWSFKTLFGFYHRLRMVPQETGRLFLLLSQGNNPSSALILDVQPRQSDQLSPSTVLDAEEVKLGEALITVKSERIKGFEIHVNGVFFSRDQSDGSLDGTTSFVIGAGKTQTITVFQRDGRGNIINKSEHTRSFQRETAYTLWIS